MDISEHLSSIFWVVLAAFHVVGFYSALQAIMKARTPQGSAAWALFLIGFPYISLPFYWTFGRGRFAGYTVARRSKDIKIQFLRKQEETTLAGPLPGLSSVSIDVYESLAGMRFRIGNAVRLLIDGDQTFKAIFEGIDSAKEYLLVQFYIVRENDELGTLFKEKLIAAARRGVRVYFLYDEIGMRLSKKYLKTLRDEKIDVRPFRNLKGPKNRFQLNFRNHRKVVVVDGRTAYVGGLNVGDDYMGKYPDMGYWRDTHVEIKGPAVGQVQVSFMEDWHWSSDTLPLIEWHFEPAVTPGKAVLALPSGPADSLETLTLCLLQAIHSAKKRIWIASPYFVPDTQIISALRLAAIRGVEVRILMPAKNDNTLCQLASYSYLKELLPWKIAMYHYQKGFMHQKVLLIDDCLSYVGTGNFDNRSFRLNFEVMAIVADTDFANEVEGMLKEDFSESKRLDMDFIEKRPYLYKLAVQFARLAAPVL